MPDALRAPTKGGGALALVDGDGACTGCKLKGGGMIDVAIVDDQGREVGAVTICGSCLAEGLAIMLGRRHLQDGGSIGDLRFPAPREGPAPGEGEGLSPEPDPAPRGTPGCICDEIGPRQYALDPGCAVHGTPDHHPV